MFPKYIKSYKDLVTTPALIKQGFLEQAIVKSEKSNPYLEKANEFRIALEQIDTVDQLLKLKNFRKEILASVGFSDKAVSHFSDEELYDSLKTVLKKLFVGNISMVREKLVFRYLLTKGDTLGGSMRNFVGTSAGIKLTQNIISALKKKKISPKIIKKKSGKISSISWANRYLVFDYKLKAIQKNVDVVLVDTSKSPVSEALLDLSNFIAFGELKGGIDPAGADEHWKTARSALGRIRKKFANSFIFFVGAAIEVDMAKEIFDELKSNELSFAANLGSEKQIMDLVNWLVGL